MEKFLGSYVFKKSFELVHKLMYIIPLICVNYINF